MNKNILLVLGDVNVDIIGTFDELPKPGGCSFSDNFTISLGGSGLNTFLGLCKLEVPAHFVSKIGQDIFGKFVQKELENILGTSHLQISNRYPTGVVFCASIKGERIFFAFRKDSADLHIYPEDLPELSYKPNIVFLTGVPIIEGAESYKTFVAEIHRLKRSGAMVFFDPNIRKIDSDTISRLEKFLKYVDVFLPSADELETILNFSKFVSIETLFKLGIKAIWVKMGALGSKFLSLNKALTFPSAPVDPVDTTGAGDAYNSAILFCYIQGFSVLETGVMANLYAGISVEKIGGSISYPGIEFLKRQDYYKFIMKGVEEV